MPQPNKSFKHVLKFSRGIISSTSMKLPTCLNDLNVHRFREVLFRIYTVVTVTTNMTFTFFPICPLFIVEKRFVGAGNYLFYLKTTDLQNKGLLNTQVLLQAESITSKLGLGIGLYNSNNPL